MADRLDIILTASQALTGSKGFIKRMKGFHQLRNDPNGGAQSDLSPFLHFGHLSAQEMALEVSHQKNKYRVSYSRLEHLSLSPAFQFALSSRVCVPAWRMADFLKCV